MRLEKLRIAAAVAAFAFIMANGAQMAWAAGQLVLPSTVLARTGEVPVTVNLPQGFTGPATLHVVWTDSLGRTVAEKTLTYNLIDETNIVFPIDMSKAVAMRNRLEVDVSLNGKDIDGKPYVKRKKYGVNFVARPPYNGWKDYVIFAWPAYQPKLIPELKQLGINAGSYPIRNTKLPDDLIDTNTRWYARQLATDYYGPYHRSHPDRPKHWAFDQAKKLYMNRPNSLAAFKRHPSFEDPYWVKRIHDRAVSAAKRLAPYRPYFYSLADESGISAMDTQWDFDMSDMSIVPMRRWLKKQYGSLGALNKEWGTHFKDWNLVMPETTTQAMARPGDNFSPWGDFKEWMDISYARAVKMGVDAIQSVDPHAYVGLTGEHMPGWGGTNYALLMKSLNLIEPEGVFGIAHSLNPKAVLISTSSDKGPWEKHRVWHKLFKGERGLILWIYSNDAYVRKDGQPGPRGVATAKFYNQIRDGEGALIINSHPAGNLMNIVYSQPSLRTRWMLWRRPLGEKWTSLAPDYNSSYGDNPFGRLRISWDDLIEDLGFQEDFISSLQIANGGLLKRSSRVLILPDSSSLSQATSNAIRQFVKDGGIAIASGVPGTYDQHSKKLPESSLADLFGEPAVKKINVRSYGKGKAILLKTDITPYLEQRLKRTAGPAHKLIGDLLRRNGVHPSFTIADSTGRSPIGVEMHVYVNGGVHIVALDSTPRHSINALTPPDSVLTKRFGHPVTVHLHLPHAMYVYNTLTRKALGQHKDLTLTVDPYEPTILAASDAPLPKMQISMPEEIQRGSILQVSVYAQPMQAETSIYHVEVLNPEGKKMVFYSGNIIAKGGGVRSIPLAENDPAGTWTVKVHDIMSGQTVIRHVNVE